jgi:hypothetical protein
MGSRESRDSRETSEGSMSLTDLLWLATAAYGVHILEEYQLNWRGWARAVIGLPVEWSDFYVTNALVIVFGVVAANLAAWPALALTFPALMLINATFLPMAGTSMGYARGSGKTPPYSATAVLAILAKVANGRTARHGRRARKYGRRRGCLILGDFVPMRGRRSEP